MCALEKCNRYERKCVCYPLYNIFLPFQLNVDIKDPDSLERDSRKFEKTLFEEKLLQFIFVGGEVTYFNILEARRIWTHHVIGHSKSTVTGRRSKNSIKPSEDLRKYHYSEYVLIVPLRGITRIQNFVDWRLVDRHRLQIIQVFLCVFNVTLQLEDCTNYNKTNN